MAANMLRRCYHLYKTSSALCIQASTAVVLGGKVGCTGALSRPLFALFSTCNHSVQRSRLCVQEKAEKLLHESHRFDDLLDSCSTVQNLLHLVELYSISGNQAARIIIQLSHMVTQKKEEFHGFLEDARFIFLLDTVAKQVTTVTNGNLVNLIKSLYFLRVEQQTPQFLSVETEVCWRLRRLIYRNLASLLDVVALHSPKEKQSKLLSELLRNLELRWREIDNTRTLVLLLTKSAILSPTLRQQLEDKALEMVEQFTLEFTLEDIRKLAMALAHQRNRSIPLLRAISYCLVQKQIDVPPKVVLDMVFACGKLSFHQTQLFQKFAMDLHPHIPDLVPEDITRCIKSFAYLKWLNLPLFEALGQYVVDNGDKLTSTHLSNIILSFAHLNFQPTSREAFYGVIHRGLEGQLETLDPYLKLDLVWSLCMLQQASAEHLQKVLMPAFHVQFLVNQSPKGQKYLLKLISVNAAARLESATYQGPFLPPNILGSEKVPRKAEPTLLQSTLKDALNGMAGNEANVRFEVDVHIGWLCDAVMVLDADNNPLPVADFVTSDLPQTKPLPPGAKRMAFLWWEFQNFMNRSKDLLGRFAMARRHIQAAGFLVVDVPFYEWHELKTEWQKTAYLKAKMSKAVAEEMAR